jgi:hypothetical protein
LIVIENEVLFEHIVIHANIAAERCTNIFGSLKFNIATVFYFVARLLTAFACAPPGFVLDATFFVFFFGFRYSGPWIQVNCVNALGE